MSVFTKTYIVLVVLLVSSCGDAGPETSTLEDASFLLSDGGSWPSDIISSRVFVIQSGDGRIGPSDYSYYVRIDVDLRFIESWDSELNLLSDGQKYADFIPPDFVPDWWVKGAIVFPEYSTDGLIRYKNGWVSIDRFNSVVHIFCYTL